MATFTETKIREALFARLAALALTPALPIAWPNTSYAPGTSAYLEPKVFPNRTRQATLGTTGMNRHLGFLQVNVVWPQNKGETAPSEAAGAIIVHFKRGTDLDREGLIITIDEPPYTTAGFNDPDNGNRFTVPVTIPYRCDAPNP